MYCTNIDRQPSDPIRPACLIVYPVSLEFVFGCLLRESVEGCRTGLHAENVELRESSSSWSGGLGNAAWSNSMASNMERLNSIGGFYTTPSAQSVWSYNAS